MGCYVSVTVVFPTFFPLSPFFLPTPLLPIMSNTASAMRALFGRTQQRLVKMGERIYAEVNILDLYTIQVDVTGMSIEEAFQAQTDAFRAEISAIEETRPHMLVQARMRRRVGAPRAYVALSRA